MMSGVNAMGALCRHRTFVQLSQSQGADWRICSSVGGSGGGGRDMPAGSADRAVKGRHEV
jgi:hypothetical protein